MEKPKKRKRISFACQYCRKRKIGCDKQKPTCSLCQRLGITCCYDSNTTLVVSRVKDELELEIERLKKKLNEETEIMIDCHYGYESLSLKSSSHEDHKPLNVSSLLKKDTFLGIFFNFIVFTQLKVPTTQTFRSRQSDGVSKWMTLLDTLNEDSDLKQSIIRIVKDRSLLFRTNIIPFTKIQHFSQEHKNMLLAKKVEQILPPKPILEKFWQLYTKFIWPLRTLTENETFKYDIDKIIQFDSELKPIIQLTCADDYSKLSIFLIILRYCNIAIKLLKDDELMFHENLLRNDISELKQYDIPVDTIICANFLMTYSFGSGACTIHHLISCLFMRCYLRECFEDGDGSSLTQSQNVFGFSVTNAIRLGLNIDGDDYLNKIVWFNIMEMDVKSCVLAGTFSCLPDERLYNVKLLEDCDGSGSEGIRRKEVKKQYELNKIYLKLSCLMNELNPIKLNQVLEILKESSDYVDKNYSLNDMISFRNLNYTDQQYADISLFNIKIFTNIMIQLCLENQIYSIIIFYFESRDLELYKQYLLQLLSTCSKLDGLIIDYLNSKYNHFISPLSKYEIMPLLGNSLLRTLTTYCSLLLRLNNSWYENQHGNQDLKNLIENITNHFINLASYYKQNYGKYYYNGLKNYALFRSIINNINNNRFGEVLKERYEDIRVFLNSDQLLMLKNNPFDKVDNEYFKKCLESFKVREKIINDKTNGNFIMDDEFLYQLFNIEFDQNVFGGVDELMRFYN